jgi:hypothetical protein
MSRFVSDLATIPDLAMLKLTIIADQATMGPTYVFEIDMGLVYTGRINNDKFSIWSMKKLTNARPLTIMYLL